ncbi:MAG TPA: hypothetical protein VIB47_06990 [Dehalococcoidia bacterium]|jgi:hypothetical protein
MDRGIWATWYDLPAEGRDQYIDYLHGVYLPAMLRRPGYLWAAHVQNVDSPEREAANYRRLTHTDDPSVPQGYRYLLLFGAEDPHVFVAPDAEEMKSALSAEERRILGLQTAARSVIFSEVGRVDGPSAARRAPGITPGPVIQFGTFNINALENEVEMNAWYAKSRLPLVARGEGNLGARRLVSIAGWPKHGILYEFVSLEAAATNLADPSDWTRRVVDNLVHAPHSPTLGVRIWPQ